MAPPSASGRRHGDQGSHKRRGVHSECSAVGCQGTEGGPVGLPTPVAMLAIAAACFGGCGLMVGWSGRVAAFGIICNMLVAG